jgi:hypothetical protein
MTLIVMALALGNALTQRQYAMARTVWNQGEEIVERALAYLT